MHYTKRSQKFYFYLVMGLFSCFLFFGYQIQFQMQRAIKYFDNYEKFDCSLFHNSLPNRNYFEDSDLKNANLDAESIAEYSLGELETEASMDIPVEESKGGQVIPHFTSIKYQKEAYSTWHYFYRPTDEQSALSSYVNGTLSCFCDDEYQQHGFSTAFIDYRADGLNQLPPKLFDQVLSNEAEADSDT